MNCLITGGAGFIGSHLAEEILRRGDDVFVIDDLSTGNIHNIQHLKAQPRFHYTIDSCANRSLLAELKSCRVETVVIESVDTLGRRLLDEPPSRV